MPRFTIHDAVWLTALCLMGAFWWADHSLFADQVRNLRTGLERETRLNNNPHRHAAASLGMQLPESIR